MTSTTTLCHGYSKSFRTTEVLSRPFSSAYGSLAEAGGPYADCLHHRCLAYRPDKWLP